MTVSRPSVPQYTDVSMPRCTSVVLLVAILLVALGCTSPASAEVRHEPARKPPPRPVEPVEWSFPEPRALCLPDPERATSPLQGRVDPTGLDYASIDCGSHGYAWPCERGIDCEAGCVCACDRDDDCGRVALDQYHPGAFDGWAFACFEGRCLVRSTDAP